MEDNLNEKIKKVVNFVDDYNKNSIDSSNIKERIWDFWEPMSHDFTEVEVINNLSIGVALELKNKNKDLYNFISTDMGGTELDKLLELIDKDKYMDISPYIKINVKLYDLIFIEFNGDKYEDIQYLYTDYVGIIFFISNNGIEYKYIKNYTDNKFPKSWYSFCQYNGLLKSGVVYLYNLCKLHKGKYKDIQGATFMKYSHKYWPYKIEIPDKLN